MSDKMMELDKFYNLHEKLGKNEIILDVRTPAEYAEGHIKNSLNIPVDQVTGRSDELKKYDTVYIHCKRGGRAKTAFDALSQQGLTNLVCIYDAGMDAWNEKGYPVVR